MKNHFTKGLCFVLLVIWSLSYAQTDGPQRVRSLVHMLEHESDFKVRIGAAQALGKLADGTVADWMLRAFRNESNDAVRLSILYAVSEIPDERIISPLIELSNQEILSSQERLLIEQILWNYQDAFNMSSWIATSLNSSDSDIQKVAIMILGIVGDDHMIPIFQKEIASPNEDIQVQTLESLAHMGSSKAIALCKVKELEPFSKRVLREAQHCEQMNSLLMQNPQSSLSHRKKLDTNMSEVAKNFVKPSHYLAYLQKNLNPRPVDQALVFLHPQAVTKDHPTTIKLFTHENMDTFQLVVDMVSQYEFDSNDLEILKSIIRENTAPIDQCYMHELMKNAELKGSVKTYFKILQSGSINQVKIVESTIGDKTVEECILDQLKQFEFPALPVDSVNLQYTFYFTPPGKQKFVF